MASRPARRSATYGAGSSSSRVPGGMPVARALPLGNVTYAMSRVSISSAREAPVSVGAHQAHVARIIGAYRQIIARAHGKGIKVIGATIMPFVGNAYYHADAQNEADRQAVNAWIMTPGNFDAVIDFDRVTRDPAHPDRLLPAYDDGDALHPSSKGYRAMGEAIPLSLFD